MWGALKIDLEKFFSKVKKRLYHENVILIEKAGDILKISTKINKKWVLIVKSRSLKVHSEIWKVPHIFKKPNLNQKVCDLNRDLRGIFGGVLFYFQLRSRFCTPLSRLNFLIKIKQPLFIKILPTPFKDQDFIATFFSFARIFHDQATLSIKSIKAQAHGNNSHSFTQNQTPHPFTKSQPTPTPIKYSLPNSLTKLN